MVIASLLSAAALAGGPVNLTIANNGHAVTVRPATPVVVTLPSNASTGFQWKILKPLDKALLRLVSHEYVGAKSKLVGAPGTEVWRFRTVGAGSFTLRLGYLRPWQPSDVETRFTVHFRVSA